MDFFDLGNGLSINLSNVMGYERTESGTRIYIHLDDFKKSVETEIPYEVIKSVIAMKTKAKSIDMSGMERNMDQLAKYQTQYVG